MVNDKNNFR